MPCPEWYRGEQRRRACLVPRYSFDWANREGLNTVNKDLGWEATYRRGEYVMREPHEDAEYLNHLFRKYHVHRILDLGCGNGRHLAYFARQGYEMCGMDIAPTALRLAEEWLAEEGLSADLGCGDMTKIHWAEDFFDAVICVKVINHHRIEGIRSAIKEIFRVLRPGGWLFLTVSTSRPSGPFRNGVVVEPNTYVLLSGREKGVPHHYFDKEELLREFSQFDLVDLHQDGTDRACMLARKPQRPVVGNSTG